MDKIILFFSDILRIFVSMIILYIISVILSWLFLRWVTRKDRDWIVAGFNIILALFPPTAILVGIIVTFINLEHNGVKKPKWL